MLRLLPAVAVALFGLSAAADDDKKPTKDENKLKGTWVREADQLTLSFTFKTKTEGTCKVEAGGASLTLTLKYEYKEDANKVSAEVTETKKEGDFPVDVPKGYKMKFTIKVDGDTAKISDYEADNAEEAKHAVEGEYRKKKAD